MKTIMEDDRKTERDNAYRERDQLVAALSKQFDAHLATHTGYWEDDWRNIVCIHLPTGQATWHIHDSELAMFSHLDRADDHWDGHSTEEKYRRLNALAVRPAPRSYPSWERHVNEPAS